MKMPKFYENAKSVIIFKKEDLDYLINLSTYSPKKNYKVIFEKHYLTVGQFSIPTVRKGGRIGFTISHEKLLLLGTLNKVDESRTLAFFDEWLSLGSVSILKSTLK